MDYLKLEIVCTDAAYTEILEAELSELNFESFETNGTQLLAYAVANTVAEDKLQEIKAAYAENIALWRTALVPHTNWNALWESQYPAVTIAERVHIRAPFHAPSAAEFDLVIMPNMSFGTGHHPTTAAVVAAMLGMNLHGRRFCDFGAGSGVLAVLAGKMGAHGVAIEIDPHAAEVCSENLRVNQVKTFTSLAADSAALAGQLFDVVAANINRNVLCENAELLASATATGGILLCSGFYVSDVAAVCEHLGEAGFNCRQGEATDGWAIIIAEKQG